MTNKKGDKTLLVQCMNLLYGSMIALVLFYKKLVTILKGNEFELNPYDPCVANKMVEDKVLTICFHMYDCKIFMSLLRWWMILLVGSKRTTKYCLKMGWAR